MFDFTQDAHVDLRDFVRLHSEALQSAAVLVGSQPWLRRMQSFIDDVLEAPEISRRLEREMDALTELLSLQHVDDPDRVEAACFVDLDPSSPYVEDICLLAEAMKDQRYRLEEGKTAREFKPILAA